MNWLPLSGKTLRLSIFFRLSIRQPDNMGEKGPEANAVVHAPGNKVHRNQHLLCLSFGWLYA